MTASSVELGQVRLSVVIPAYNEEQRLPSTLAHIGRALNKLSSTSEVIVVDNDSSDATGQIAAANRATVVFEKEHNIGRVRNAGAAAAQGDVLMFIDADTIVDETLFDHVLSAMDDERCVGGAVAVRYDLIARRWVRLYLKGWAFWGTVFGMAQGAGQFCRRDVFNQVGRYDETIYMGEDIEFYWRLSRFARRTGRRVHFVTEPPVVTSGRRFDKMSIGKTLLLTHPVFIRLTWRRKTWWKDWYERTVR